MNYIFLDMEFTTLGPKSLAKDMEIISIGAIKTNASLRTLDTFYTTVKPNSNPILSDFCKELTNITQLEIDGSPPLITALENLEDFMGKDSQIYTWGDFDKFIMRKEIRKNKYRCKYKVINSHFIDLSKAFFSLVNNELPSTCDSLSLLSSAKLLNIPVSNTHNSLTDSTILKEIASLYPKLLINSSTDKPYNKPLP